MSFWDKLKFWGKTTEQKKAEEIARHEKEVLKQAEDKKREDDNYAKNLSEIQKNATTENPVAGPQQTPPVSNGSGVATTSTTTNGAGQIAPATTTTAPASAIGGRKSKRSRRIKRKNTKRKR